MKLSAWTARIFAILATFTIATLLFSPGFTLQVSDLPEVQIARCYPTEPEPSPSPTPSPAPAPKFQLV
jgi:hypothetical protein